MLFFPGTEVKMPIENVAGGFLSFMYGDEAP